MIGTRWPIDRQWHVIFWRVKFGKIYTNFQRSKGVDKLFEYAFLIQVKKTTRNLYCECPQTYPPHAPDAPTHNHHRPDRKRRSNKSQYLPSTYSHR